MKQPVDSRLPRVAVFIVKRDIEIFVWPVAESIDIYLICRGDHRSSEVVTVTNCTFVHRRNNDLYLAGRGRRPRRPEKDKDKSQNFDRKSFLNCRDRCVHATSCRLSGYANGHRYATTCNLNHSRRCILYRYDIGQSRTPVPTGLI